MPRSPDPDPPPGPRPSRDPAPPSAPRPLRVGLTGNVGSGKSTVARLLAERGAAVIDADALAREATSDPGVLARIEAELGPGLVRGGALDRAALAERAFGDAAARARLEAIVHPEVGRRRAARERALAGAPDPPRVIVHDVPLLFEVGLDADVDETVVVVAPLDVRARRAAERGGMSEAQARARDAAQMPLDEKARRADRVLDNGGSLEGLERQVDALWRAWTGA